MITPAITKKGRSRLRRRRRQGPVAVTPSASYSLTLRIQLENEPGMLGDVTSAIGEAGGSVGAIDIVKAEGGKLVRDITVDARSQEHWNQIITALREVEGVELLDVT